MKNVVDKIYGRKISEEHMVSLIAWNENDFNVIGLEEMVECVKNDLEHYMKKHDYEYIGLKCPMCEQGTLIHETINNVEYYSCSECPMVAIEDYDYNLRDKLKEDAK